MPSLRDLKNRISSVTSTRKITSAMKMVAASRFRRAHDQTVSVRPYAESIRRLLTNAYSAVTASSDDEGALQGTLPLALTKEGEPQTVLFVVITSDRGLCGAFNSGIVREARRQIRQYQARGKIVKLLCIGKKGRDLLKREFGDAIIDSVLCAAKGRLAYSGPEALAQKVMGLFESKEIDVAYLVYNRFNSAISQVATFKQILPLSLDEESAPKGELSQPSSKQPTDYIFEPGPVALLQELLPRYVGMQVFSAMLDSIAGEHGARMTAMDNATRNAGDMINKLTLNYNRSRQAYITKELIEIISGAEAV